MLISRYIGKAVADFFYIVADRGLLQVEFLFLYFSEIKYLVYHPYHTVGIFENELQLTFYVFGRMAVVQDIFHRRYNHRQRSAYFMRNIGEETYLHFGLFVLEFYLILQTIEYKQYTHDQVDEKYYCCDIQQVCPSCLPERRSDLYIQYMFVVHPYPVGRSYFDPVFSGGEVCVIRKSLILSYNPFLIEPFEHIGIYDTGRIYVIQSHKFEADYILFVVQFYVFQIINILFERRVFSHCNVFVADLEFG